MRSPFRSTRWIQRRPDFPARQVLTISASPRLYQHQSHEVVRPIAAGIVREVRARSDPAQVRPSLAVRSGVVAETGMFEIEKSLHAPAGGVGHLAGLVEAV